MGKFRDESLESYVEAMYQASGMILDERPDYILAPMNGSVPFIDAMTIVNSDFDPSKVVYMPASSRIDDVNKVMYNWYSNFLDDTVQSPHHFPKVLGIDEVVGGGSVIRCLHNIDKAIARKKNIESQRLARKLISSEGTAGIEVIDEIDTISDHEHALELGGIRRQLSEGFYKKHRGEAKVAVKTVIDIAKQVLLQKLLYRTVGIEDSKGEGRRNKEYVEARENGRVIPVSVKSIISMDIPDFCPPRFEEITPHGKGGYVRFSPVVRDFCVTPRYLDFLQGLARHVGKDPDSVDPVNMIRILDSKKYLDPKYTQ